VCEDVTPSVTSVVVDLMYTLPFLQRLCQAPTSCGSKSQGLFAVKVTCVTVQCSFNIAECRAKLGSEFVNTAVRDRDTAVAKQPDQLWLGLGCQVHNTCSIDCHAGNVVTSNMAAVLLALALLFVVIVKLTY